MMIIMMTMMMMVVMMMMMVMIYNDDDISLSKIYQFHLPIKDLSIKSYFVLKAAGFHFTFLFNKKSAIL